MRIASVAIALALSTSVAHADDDSFAPVAYGVTTLELGMFGVFYGNFTNVWSSNGPGLALNFTPIALGVGAAFGAHYGELDPRPALAIHGAGWLGVTGLMAGALLDGRERAWNTELGPFAWTLGALGAVGGGLFGSLAVDGSTESAWWMAAPPAGFVAGGLFIGGMLVLIGGVDGDDAIGQFMTGAIIGTGLGLGLATYMALTGTESQPSTRVQPSVANATLSNDRATIFSFGGAF